MVGATYIEETALIIAAATTAKVHGNNPYSKNSRSSKSSNNNINL